MKKRWIALITIVSLIVLASIIAVVYFGFISQSVVLPATTKGFTQYESDSCGSYNCLYTNPLIKSGTAEFNIGGNQWKIVNSGGSWGSCESHGGGYITGGCCTTTEVYKNGNLIDTIKQGYTTEDGSNPNTAYQVKTYCSDGTYDTCPTSIGIGVYPDRWGSTIGMGECVNRQNDYQIFLPSGTFSIDTTSDKNAYQVGDVIFFNIKVQNNLFDTRIKLKMNYVVPTIFGDKTKTEEKEVDVTYGENLVNFSLAISEPSRIISVTPELEVYYKTSNIKGVNFNYPEGLKPIDFKEYFTLGSVSDSPLILNVTSTSDTVTKTCKDYGCPSGYSCQDNGVCKQDFNMMLVWYILGGIVILAIVIFIIVIVLRKARRKR